MFGTAPTTKYHPISLEQNKWSIRYGLAYICSAIEQVAVSEEENKPQEDQKFGYFVNREKIISLFTPQIFLSYINSPFSNKTDL